MKLEKQDIGIWVKASEPPIETKIYYCKCILYRQDRQYKDFEQLSSYNTFINQWHVDSATLTVTHWLKPVKDIFVLTFDELNVFIKEFNIFLVQKGNPDNSLSENTNEFIKSLTK